MTAFFLTQRGTDVWCAEHNAPIAKRGTGPTFGSEEEARDFVQASREWYEGPAAPKHCLFLHPDGAALAPSARPAPGLHGGRAHVPCCWCGEHHEEGE